MPTNQDKSDDPDYWQCQRCRQFFHEDFDIMRPRAGYWVEERPNGEVEEYRLVCEDCYKLLINRWKA